jgi:hypothetical protein
MFVIMVCQWSETVCQEADPCMVASVMSVRYLVHFIYLNVNDLIIYARVKDEGQTYFL